MAHLIGGLGTSHIPAIGNAIHKGLQNEPYWKPFFDGFPPIREWLAAQRPDVVVVFYNDHGLNFFLDKMPTFAVGAAERYCNADEGWGIPTLALRGHAELSWHLIESLVGRTSMWSAARRCWWTTPARCRSLFWPEGDCPVAVVPVCINTVQFPLPSARRCYALGQAVGRAIARWNSDQRVAVIASGACRTSSMASARASSTRPSTCSSLKAWPPIPNGPRSSACMNSWKRPAPRAWNC